MILYLPLSSINGVTMHHVLMKTFGFNLLVTTNIRKLASLMVDKNAYINRYSFTTYRTSNLCHQNRKFSTSTESSCDKMFKKLENAVLECKEDEIWKVFTKFKSLYGSPPPRVMSKLILGLSYSSNPHSLPKAFNLVSKIAKKEFVLLEHDTLSSLCLSLARAQMPIPTSKILRLTIQKNCVPSMDMLCSIFMHLVKTEVGTCLASIILLKICDRFHHFSAKRSECAISMKPSTAIFNLILESCVRFRSGIKGQNIIEAMARIRIVADLHSVVLFSFVYEMNGLRDELKKFKEFVDRVSIPLARYYALFYDKLLSLHYDFDDVDACASLVMGIYFFPGLRPQQPNEDLMKPIQVPIGPPNLKNGLKVQVVFELLRKDFLINVEGGEEFVVFKNGKPLLTNKGFAQLIIKYKRSKRISELSELLATIQKKIDSLEMGNLCCDVIHACVNSGFLEMAHDILDDMEMANVHVPSSTYMVLLSAYRRENMVKEDEALVKQIKRIGFPIEESDEMIVSQRVSEITFYLAQEVNKEYEASSKVFELNSCIYFFCKANMMEDAKKIYKKMQLMNIQPTFQTFVYLIQGYSSLEIYREITILWGDIKRFMYDGCSLANRDLYEFLVINFIRGGYFERVLEVLRYMKDNNMYVDRWMYKEEFLRRHKNLYRSLKAIDVCTEAQRLRLEHVKAFRMWFRNN